MPSLVNALLEAAAVSLTDATRFLRWIGGRRGRPGEVRSYRLQAGGPRRGVVALALALAVGLNLAIVPQAVASPPPGAPVVPEPAPAEVEDSDGDGSLDQPDLASAAVAAHQLDEAVEDLSQRSETARVVVNPDGSITEQLFGAPMWVQDEDGEWVDVDYTLVPRDSGGFVPKAAPTDLVIDGGGKEFARLTLPDGTVTVWSWPRTLTNPTVDGPVATYAVGDGVDLLVTATARGVSTRIQVNTPTAVIPAFRVKVRTYGAELKQGDAGGMLLADDEGGDPSASIAVLSAWDARRDAFGDPVKVVPVAATLTETAAVGDRVDQELALTVPTELVDDPEVVYPLTIDPDMSAFAPVQDAWAREGVGWVSDLHYRLLVGASKDHSNSNTAVSLVQWDDGRDRNRNISNAEVGFFQYMSASCSSKRMNIHQVLGSWSESTLTWANKPGVSTAAATSSYLTKNIGASGCTPAGGFVTADVTGLVQSWADGASNVGMQLSVPDANKNDFSFERRLCSTNYDTSHTTCNKAARTPYLKFTYTNRKPYKPFDFKIDLSNAPRTFGNRQWVSSSSVTFSAATVGVYGGKIQMVYEFRASQEAPAVLGTCTTPVVDWWIVAACTASLPPGGYSVRVKAVDIDGLVSDWSDWLTMGVELAPPSAPTSLDFSHDSSLVAAATTSSTPTLAATLTVPSGGACLTPGGCLKGEFTVLDSHGNQVWSGTSAPVGNGGVASVVVPTGQLNDLTLYTIRAVAVSVDSGSGSSAASIAMSTVFSISPPAPGTLQLVNGSTVATEPTPKVTVQRPTLRATMPSGALCGLGHPACLRAEFTVKRASDSTVVFGPAVVSGLTSGQVTDVTSSVDLADGGTYVLAVRTFNELTGLWSVAANATFRVVLPLTTPDLTWLTPDGTTLRLGIAGVPAASYSWTVTLTSRTDSSTVELEGTSVPVNGELRIPLSLASGEWDVDVQARGVNGDGDSSALSDLVHDSITA